jgi:hypothetical protein
LFRWFECQLFWYSRVIVYPRCGVLNVAGAGKARKA